MRKRQSPKDNCPSDWSDLLFSESSIFLKIRMVQKYHESTRLSSEVITF